MAFVVAAIAAGAAAYLLATREVEAPTVTQPVAPTETVAEPIPAMAPPPGEPRPPAPDIEPAPAPADPLPILRAAAVDAVSGVRLTAFETRFTAPETTAWIKHEDAAEGVSLTLPGAGEIGLEARAPGGPAVAVALPEELAESQDAPDDIFEIALSRPLAAQGIVIDADTGEPVSGAELRVYHAAEAPIAPDQPAPPEALETFTDFDGHFTIEDPGAAFRLLTVWSPGYAPLVRLRYAPDPGRFEEFALTRGGGIRGALTVNGQPAEALPVPGLLLDAALPPLLPVERPHIEDGEFNYETLTAGLYVFRIVLSNGAEWGRFPVDVANGYVTEGAWEMDDFGRVRGNVPNPGGLPMHAELALASFPDLPLYRTPVDAHGGFLLGWAPADTYIIRLIRDGVPPATRTIAYPFHPGIDNTIRLAAPE